MAGYVGHGSNPKAVTGAGAANDRKVRTHAIWLQRFLVPSGLSTDYSEPLTRAVVEPHFQLWNSDWLPNSARQLLVADRYVDSTVLVNLEAVVGTDEVELFPY